MTIFILLRSRQTGIDYNLVKNVIYRKVLVPYIIV